MQTGLKTAILPFDSRTRALSRTVIAILVIFLAAWVAREFFGQAGRSIAASRTMDDSG
jgi:hypothetical protein